MAAKSGDDNAITDINIVPLVDIVLVLLIIFMVTATYIVSPQIKVELPKAATGEKSEPNNFAIVISKDGDLYLDGEKTDAAGIGAAIVERLKNEPDLQAVISADKDVLHGRVVEIVDLVRRNGCRKFAINIDPATVEAMKKQDAEAGSAKAAEKTPEEKNAA